MKKFREADISGEVYEDQYKYEYTCDICCYAKRAGTGSGNNKTEIWRTIKMQIVRHKSRNFQTCFPLFISEHYK